MPVPVIIMFWKKKCEWCGEELSKGKGLKERVEVYGRTDRPERIFCSADHLDLFRKRTEELTRTRRFTCSSCLR